YSAAPAIGPLLAGLLVATVPLPALLLLDALSFLLSAGSLALLRTSFNPSGSGPPPGLRRAVAVGLAYVLRHPVLGPVTAMAALVVLVSSPVGSQVVLFAKERLQVNEPQLGLLYSAQNARVLLLSLPAGLLLNPCSFRSLVLG